MSNYYHHPNYPQSSAYGQYPDIQYNYPQAANYNQYRPGYQGQYGHSYYNYSQNYGYEYNGEGYQYEQANSSNGPAPVRNYNQNQPQHDRKRKLHDKDVKKTPNVSAKEAFPVSCGTQHKQHAEGFVPKRVPIPPDVMSRMALAKARLEANPTDPKAHCELNAVMVEYQTYQNEKNSALVNEADEARRKTGYDGPGLFTGQELIKPMSREEIDSDDIRTFAQPDMFKNLTPLKDNYGKSLMRKFGWKEGNPLGTSGAGSLAPIEVTVKIDRRGLCDDREYIKKKPEGLAKNNGPNWICKIVNTKNPVCGISEMHQALGLPTPIFKLVSEDNGIFKWSVSTNWGCFTPFKATKSKKQAKSECAYRAIQEILRMESESKGVEPPTEAEESCFLRCIFIPSNKTAAGYKMLYRHFYSGGQLTNVLEPPGYNASLYNKPVSLSADQHYSASYEEAPTSSFDVVKPATASVLNPTPLRTGSEWMLKSINGKNASSALLDLCVEANKPSPDEYWQYMSGRHVITVTTPWGTFSHSEGGKSKREVRKITCYNAIKEILRNEALKYNCKPPVELAESDHNNVSFAPDPC